MTDRIAGRRIAIIGGAGFIGHHLALTLAARRAEVHVVDSLQVNNLRSFESAGPEVEHRMLYVRMLKERQDRLWAAGVQLHVQDARDYHALSRLLTGIAPDVIVHMAAISHAGRSNKDPFNTFDHSLRTLENALDYARGRVEQFVFFSSSMVYGNFQTPEVDETHPLEPIGIYGALKVAGEKIVIAYEQVFDLPYTIVRPSALYGPRCVSRRVGQLFIEAAMLGRELRVEGDGSERLDFTYIDDLVEGLCLAIGNPAAHNQTFNLTYGQSRTVNELVDILRLHLPGIRVTHVERDALRPMRGTLSIARAVDRLGFAPSVPLEVGLPRYLDWYRSLSGEAAFV